MKEIRQAVAWFAQGFFVSLGVGIGWPAAAYLLRKLLG